MPPIDLAQRKWARKMAEAGPRWKTGVTGKEDEFCKGVARFVGVGTCDPSKMELFRSGVGAVTSEDFQTAVRGKGPKWRAEYIEAMT